jgi:hypothetical protein
MLKQLFKKETLYLDAVKTHQHVLEANLYSKVRRERMSLPGGRMRMSFAVEPADFQSLPAFTISHASPPEALKSNWASIISLVFWLIVPFAAA